MPLRESYRTMEKVFLNHFVKITILTHGFPRIDVLIPDGSIFDIMDGLRVSANEDKKGDVTCSYSYIEGENGVTRRVRPITVPLKYGKDHPFTFSYVQDNLSHERKAKITLLDYEEGEDLFLRIHPDREEELIELYGSEEERGTFTSSKEIFLGDRSIIEEQERRNYDNDDKK